jgi:hypothetical protein
MKVQDGASGTPLHKRVVVVLELVALEVPVDVLVSVPVVLKVV